MEVVQRTDDGPFGRRDVEEWSRLDELTGMLEHARVQTDRWAGVDSLGGSHKYGKKVVDATKTGGAGQHRQRQQLEVFQSRVPGGAMQVIRTQTASSWSQQGPSRLAATKSTVSSSSTSSRTRWSTRSTTGSSTTQDRSLEPAENFANLELALNPIDVSSLKMKACVGRSGSIGGRRPPSTRSRRLSASGSIQEKEPLAICAPNQEDSDDSSHTNKHLTELSRMCQQVHEEQKRRFNTSDEEEFKMSLPLGRRFSKSSSTDDIPAEIVARDEQDEGMSSWRRGARVRRSLQFSSRDGDRASGVCVPVPATKRHSFVTVDSLREVRGRLRHLTSDQVEKSGIKNGVLKIPDYRRHDDENDDGIASEETAAESDSPVNTLRGCKTYSAPPATSSGSVGQQTNSLESRSSRASAAARSDEWFNRRKSYGFEQVHNQSSDRGSRITEGNKTESSDSGISRSTETVPSNHLPTPWSDNSKSNTTYEESEHVRKKTIVTLNAMNSANKWNEKAVGDVSPTRRRFSESSAFFRNVTTEAQTAARRANAAPKPTTITIPIVFQQETDSTERKKFSLRQLPEANRPCTNGVSTSPTTDPETLGWASRRQLDGLGPAKRRSWAGDSPLMSQEHSSSNYNSDCDDILTRTNRTNTTISLESTNSGDIDTEDISTNSALLKKTKRVEFCKTEVHFAAESGRFHIIETDEKPPPSNNFRRRRRSQPASTATSTTPAIPVVAQKPPLPELRFGDSIYEKKMLMTSQTPSEPKEVNVPIQIEVGDSIEKGGDEHIYASANATIISGDLSSEDSGRNTDSEDSRSRIVFKRMSLDESAESKINKEDSKVWGVKLRPVAKIEPMSSSSPITTSSPVAPPVWRSTVTLRNQTAEENTSLSSPGQMELQKLLRSLRPASSQRHSLDLSSCGSPVTDTTSAWSVAERIRQAEERKSARGFSTKVNLGGAGETTVLQSADWLGETISESPVREQTETLVGHVNNNSRPLVVRIGKKEDVSSPLASSNGYLSLTSDNLISNKSTSINIDHNRTSSPKYRADAMRRASTGVLRSPSLIMQTICQSFSPARMKDIEEPARLSMPELGVPGQLAALKQLYEAAGEDYDSDAADREVSALMSPEDPNPPRSKTTPSPCGGSVVSGSWSKMRAVKLSQQFHKYQPPASADNIKKPPVTHSGFVRLTQPSEESTTLLLRPVPMARRRSSASKELSSKNITMQDMHTVTTKQGTSIAEPPALQVTAATFSVPSYTSSSTSEQQGRLRSVDTLVSTRSGAPRITSISLHYEGEGDKNKSSSPVVTKPTTSIPSKTVTSLFSSSRPTLTSNSNRSVTSISSRLTSSPAKQDEVRSSPTKINLSAITRTSISPAGSTRTSLSPAKSAGGLPPRGSSPCRRSVSPAASSRSPQVRVPITAPARRVSSPCEQVTKKTTPQQTFFGAEVLEVEPRPEDRRGEDEIVSTRTTTVTEKTSVRPLSSYRSASRGRLPEYTSSVSKTQTGSTDSARARSLSPVKRLNKVVIADNPIYQNQAAISATKFLPATEAVPKSSAALIEELTRAADEILQAVNGYSDDSPASSDDEKPKARLSSLREGEVSRTEERTPRKKTVTAASRLKKKVGPTSSTSSVESISKEQRIVKRPALPGVRSSHISTRPAVPIPGSPTQSASDEGGSGRRVRTTRRRATTSPQQPTKEEEEATKARERSEARAERLRSSRPRRPRTSARQAEEVAASGKRVLVPDLSKSRAPVERIIPAAPRKSPSKPRKEEHHQLTRTANGATAERRLQLIESGTSSSSRTCAGASASASGIGGRMKSRGDGLKITSK